MHARKAISTLALVGLAAALFSAAACEDDAPSGGPSVLGGPDDPNVGTSDASASRDATSNEERDAGSTDAAGACNALTQQAETVSWVTSTAAAPVPSGGDVVDGIYTLTAFTLFTDAVADGTVVLEIGKTTAELRLGTLSVLLTDKDGADRRVTETLTLAGVDLTTSLVCVSGAVDGGAQQATRNGKYTATATSFTIFFPNPNGTIANVYTKR